MKIAILYISIGKYDVFWEEFYKSCEMYFLTQEEKVYFLFTDSNNLKTQINNININIIDIASCKWPYSTLLRFDHFSKIADRLNMFDYVFYLNSNVLFISDIKSKEVIPNSSVEYIGLDWKKYSKINFPYERNPNSTAYIPFNRGENYFQGGFFGAKASSFINMTLSLKENIQQDLHENIIAKCHDESHLNHFFLNKDIHILESIYGRPEEWINPINPKLIFRNKEVYFGSFNMLKMKNHNIFNAIIVFIKSRLIKLLR